MGVIERLLVGVLARFRVFVIVCLCDFTFSLIEIQVDVWGRSVRGGSRVFYRKIALSKGWLCDWVSV